MASNYDNDCSNKFNSKNEKDSKNCSGSSRNFSLSGIFRKPCPQQTAVENETVYQNMTERKINLHSITERNIKLKPNLNSVQEVSLQQSMNEDDSSKTVINSRDSFSGAVSFVDKTHNKRMETKYLDTKRKNDPKLSLSLNTHPSKSLTDTSFQSKNVYFQEGTSNSKTSLSTSGLKFKNFGRKEDQLMSTNSTRPCSSPIPVPPKLFEIKRSSISVKTNSFPDKAFKKTKVPCVKDAHGFIDCKTPTSNIGERKLKESLTLQLHTKVSEEKVLNEEKKQFFSKVKSLIEKFSVKVDSVSFFKKNLPNEGNMEVQEWDEGARNETASFSNTNSNYSDSLKNVLNVAAAKSLNIPTASSANSQRVEPRATNVPKHFSTSVNVFKNHTIYNKNRDESKDCQYATVQPKAQRGLVSPLSEIYPSSDDEVFHYSKNRDESKDCQYATVQPKAQRGLVSPLSKIYPSSDDEVFHYFSSEYQEKTQFLSYQMSSSSVITNFYLNETVQPKLPKSFGSHVFEMDNNLNEEPLKPLSDVQRLIEFFSLYASNSNSDKTTSNMKATVQSKAQTTIVSHAAKRGTDFDKEPFQPPSLGKRQNESFVVGLRQNNAKALKDVREEAKRILEALTSDITNMYKENEHPQTLSCVKNLSRTRTNTAQFMLTEFSVVPAESRHESSSSSTDLSSPGVEKKNILEISVLQLWCIDIRHKIQEVVSLIYSALEGWIEGQLFLNEEQYENFNGIKEKFLGLKTRCQNYIVDITLKITSFSKSPCPQILLLRLYLEQSERCLVTLEHVLIMLKMHDTLC